jgi:hypothetical protein
MGELRLEHTGGAEPKSGKYIIQATKTSSGSTACDQNVNLIAGHTYRIGAWVRKSGDFAVSNASNTKISIRNSSGPLKDIPITTSIGTGWTEIFGDYKPSSDAALTISCVPACRPVICMQMMYFALMSAIKWQIQRTLRHLLP